MIAACPERDVLRGYANGTVAEDQADQLSTHLRDCSSCQQWLADTSDLDDSLVLQLRAPTVDDSFGLEPECQSAMARALGALATESPQIEEGDISLPGSMGDYEIVRRIGRGGMGNVYLAQHTRLDRTVAVKVLASHRLSDPRMHDRFEKEMKAIGSLSHPNIVIAHDARDVDGVALLVTEWIDGLNLKDIVDRVGPLEVADACEIGVRIADALQYICSESLIHRDLKPSNVMISRDGEVKLLDLGLARLRSSDAEGQRDVTATGQAMGTADYVAPEQINDARDVDIRADIYSLGCTLYKLFSGRAPFESERYLTTFSKLTAHVSDQPLPLRKVAPHVPQAISDLVGQMLAKSPEDRPESADWIKAKLQVHVSGADLQALIREALASEANAPACRRNTTTVRDDVNTRPTTQGFWNRRVPIAAAIASGLAGLILGWLCGVVITITHPDGSKTELNVPENASVTVGENGQIDVAIKSAETPEIPSAALQPPDDTAKFEGVWRMESAMYRGRGAPFQWNQHGSMLFHDKYFIQMQRSKQVLVGTFELDSDLYRITLEGTVPGENSYKTYKGLYQFSPSGKLQICVNDADSDDFPTTFDAPGAFNTATLTLGRVEIPTDPTSLKAFIEEPSTSEMSHAVVAYNELKTRLRPDAMGGTPGAANVKASTLSKLKQMGIAFHIFHDVHQHLPASNAARSGTKPKEGEFPCSWRVAILPYVEQQSLYDQYHFDEPWDSQHNMTLLEKMPEIYRRPGDDPNSHFTGFVGFVGENTALGDGDAKRFRDFTDGLSNTLLLVAAETEIPWTKPEDCPLSELSKFGLLKGEKLQVLMGDGRAQSISTESEEAIRQAAIINDGKF